MKFFYIWSGVIWLDVKHSGVLCPEGGAGPGGVEQRATGQCVQTESRAGAHSAPHHRAGGSAAHCARW